MECSFRPVQNKLMEYTYLKKTLSFLRHVKSLSFVCKTNYMSLIVKYIVARFGCLWKNLTH